jgi:hypothetical protein
MERRCGRLLERIERISIDHEPLFELCQEFPFGTSLIYGKVYLNGIKKAILKSRSTLYQMH